MIYITLPAMNENNYLFKTMDHLERQTYKDFTFTVCVNQPDEYYDYDNEKHKEIIENNQLTLKKLIECKENKKYSYPLEIIDKSTKGFGWQGKKHGVGWARKVVMDRALELSIARGGFDKDIMVTLDADTEFNNNYLETIKENFEEHKKDKIVGISIPVYHKLTGSEREDRAILRYELYLRYYALNMWRINSYYNFTAVGSAMAVPVKIYKKVSGMTPKLSGEDFYFLQKLRKHGRILQWNKEKVYPAARFSSRVFFGTGPAMIKGDSGDWSSHPIYAHTLFDKVKETTDLFPKLYREDQESEMISFLKTQLGENLWQPLRANSKNEKQFVKFCHEKVDGLRILQFLKSKNEQILESNEEKLKDFVDTFFPKTNFAKSVGNLTSFDNASVAELDLIRNEMVKLEDQIYARQKWCF